MKIVSPDWDHWADWPQVAVLAFDQSLAKTGWAWVIFWPGMRPQVREVGTLVTEPHADLSGFADSLARAENLHEMATEIVDAFATHYWDGHSVGIPNNTFVVHEAPALPLKVSQNREAGPLAALSVRLAARRHGMEMVMVDARHAKKWVTGNGYAEKKQVQVGVRAALGVEKLTFRTNEHIWDAIALAMAFALDIRMEQL